MNDEFLNRMQEEMEEDLFGKRRSPQLPSPDPTIHKNEGYNHKAKERSSEEDEIKIRQSANESGNNSIIVAGKTEAKGINFTRPHVHDPPCMEKVNEKEELPAAAASDVTDLVEDDANDTALVDQNKGNIST
ncbi:uncharacterized protein LOC121774240 [Salvia splendens]|uniref:uncharacterized protein LOC121774240 n=1 Tax=Salvia splendens TaxID=180675 RepID=UPI001C27AA55|nr:uncharacterized protein LOC121774240 [Salvia splendens]